MPDWPPADPADAAAIADRRGEIVAAVRDHAGQIAYQLARLKGGDDGRATIDTDHGAWTVEYEGGDLSYLRFDPRRGEEVYVVSTKEPPRPERLTEALADYPAFIAGFNDDVAALDGALDDVTTEFPAVGTTDAVVAERERVLGRIREVCDRIAGELHRYEGDDYGTFATRVADTRWELKWDHDSASYLRVGGSSGVYLLSQYEPPAAADIREYTPRFSEFVRAYNDHVTELEADLETIGVSVAG